MPDDDRAVMERLAALEAEVKAEADARQARKTAAAARLRDPRRARPERDEPGMRGRAAGLPDDSVDEPAARHDAGTQGGGGGSPLEDLGGALELASKANRVKQELQRTPGKGEKSWIKSGVASLALGPVGWLYAGSLREAVPAAVASVVLTPLPWQILPVFLVPFLMPILMVALPLSAIAGVVYALQYNRTGERQRLFGGDERKPKQITGAEPPSSRGSRAGSKPRQLRSGRGTF